MCLRIWGLDGSNPVTLKGHSGAILDTAIVSRGRNILSSARDGTVRLWECASGSVLYKWELSSPVHHLSLGCLKEREEITNDDVPSREVDTLGKLLCLVTESGRVEGYDLGTKDRLFVLAPGKSPLVALALNETFLVSGSVRLFFWEY